VGPGPGDVGPCTRSLFPLFNDGTDFELCMGAWGAMFRLESPMWFCSLRSLEGKSLSLIRRGPDSLLLQSISLS